MNKEIMEKVEELSKTIENLAQITNNVLDASIELTNEVTSIQRRLNEVELNNEQKGKKEPLVAPVMCIETPYPRRPNVFKRTYNGIRRYLANS
tara:strand:+ start:747 stop:1025 length:279 start_codon:yes stop_codon:yes gene_type:complete